MHPKIKSVNALATILNRLRTQGKRIVFTNGCFDIMHIGHVKYLNKARSLGDVLVVGLNGDASVRSIKGKGRPINNENDRAQILASLCFVDYVTKFNELTPAKLIRRLRPDILVKGGDWKVEDIVGSDFVRSYGGKVVSVPFVKGYSTTSIIKSCKKRYFA